MENVKMALVIFNSLSFFGYGTTCILTRHMKREFERYGVPQFRVLTGGCQLVASIFMLLGYWSPLFILLGALMIIVMMGVGVFVRFRIGDRALLIVPAFGYFVLNIVILWLYGTQAMLLLR